ncbi:unnamed protein product [Moneuplotes crassus]|uniref:Uncharacterized protein n=1 Tax=Euplotes crassus TaxID=5936 RepID=A0AAD2D7D5_EUPCR|nr:unnamed protein product [Moneuplotes crassus]
MDSQRNEDNRQTVIDYPEYDQYPDDEYEHRFSLHSGADIRLTNNQMMPDSADHANREVIQEDIGNYYGRGTDMRQNQVPPLNFNNNFVQDYNLSNEQAYQILPKGKQNSTSSVGGKTLKDRMDALDEIHPIHTEIDEASENVEADEREGNGDFIQRQISLEKDAYSEFNENTSQANYYNQLEIERRMDRMGVNPQMNEFTGPSQDFSSNINPMQTPSRRIDESFQNMNEYQSQAPGPLMSEDQNTAQNDQMIMQYESVLQNVNSEFQKLLEKNKQCEEELSMTKIQLEKSQVALEQEQANLASRMNEEKKLEMVKLEKNEIENENKSLRMQIGQKDDEIERLQNRIIQLEHEASQVPALRAQLDDLESRNHQKETTTREKEESILKTESELRNMERVEGVLKAEIEELLEKRKGLEEINQTLKNQICECNIALRQMASQLDSSKRENMALTNNVEIFKRSEEQLREENSSLKELVNNIEIERIHFRASCELLQRDLSFAKKEIASYIASENRVMNIGLPMGNLHNYPSQIPKINPDSNGPPNNFQGPIPNPQVNATPLSHSGPQNVGPNSQETFKPPQSAFPSQEDMAKRFGDMSLEEFKKATIPANNMPNTMGNQPPAGSSSKPKLPQHLASSITFDDNDGSEQYYRKNQTTDPTQAPQNNPPADSKVAGIPSVPNLPTAGIPTPKDPQPGPSLPQFTQGSQNSQPRFLNPPVQHNPPGPAPGPHSTPQAPSQNPSAPSSFQIPQGPAPEMNSDQKFQKIHTLENSLLSFQMDKDRLVAELGKIPEAHSKSHHQQQRKAELEREIFIADKNINTVKLKLRDLKK